MEEKLLNISKFLGCHQKTPNCECGIAKYRSRGLIKYLIKSWDSKRLGRFLNFEKQILSSILVAELENDRESFLKVISLHLPISSTSIAFFSFCFWSNHILFISDWMTIETKKEKKTPKRDFNSNVHSQCFLFQRFFLWCPSFLQNQRSSDRSDALNQR